MLSGVLPFASQLDFYCFGPCCGRKALLEHFVLTSKVNQDNLVTDLYAELVPWDIGDAVISAARVHRGFQETKRISQCRRLLLRFVLCLPGCIQGAQIWSSGKALKLSS